MDEREDNSYLKQYVKNHPDNQMAWYLLGKDYMLQGKEAKANYCFLQAGDVYEAYEKKKHELAAKSPEEAIRSYNRKRRFKSAAGRTAAAAALLLALSVAAPASPGEGPAGTPPQKLELLHDGGAAVVFVPQADASSAGSALQRLLYSSGGAAYGLAVQLGKAGKWRMWTGETRVLLSVERPAGGASASVSLLDAASCDCTPADADKAYRTLGEWSAQREQQWVLTSAIRQYRERAKKWPESLAQLVRPYPDNVLSGDTADMEAMFEGALERAKNSAAGVSDVAGKGAGQSGAAAAGGDDPGVLINGGIPDGLPDKPLEIVVDRKTHRLALVSGDVIVRSYQVGLGGSRTPEGSFVISEKVRNPNGRDDGDFGSRGMTLSDTLYAIHGTNEPDSIGRDESLGCIRMLRADVEELFDMTPIGTKVTIKSGVLPAHVSKQPQRFRLHPRQDETNPAKVYKWLN